VIIELLPIKIKIMMYTLARKYFDNKVMDIVVIKGYVSVCGKRYDREKRCYLAPFLANLAHIPDALVKEVSSRIKFDDPPTAPMSLELKRFCNDIWQKAANESCFYNRK